MNQHEQNPSFINSPFLTYRSRYCVEFARIPISPEQRPEDDYLDEYVKIVKDVDINDPLVFNCGMGVGRSLRASLHQCSLICSYIWHGGCTHAPTITADAIWSFGSLRFFSVRAGDGFIGNDRSLNHVACSSNSRTRWLAFHGSHYLGKLFVEIMMP